MGVRVGMNVGDGWFGLVGREGRGGQGKRSNCIAVRHVATACFAVFGTLLAELQSRALLHGAPKTAAASIAAPHLSPEAATQNELARPLVMLSHGLMDVPVVCPTVTCSLDRERTSPP